MINIFVLGKKYKVQLSDFSHETGNFLGLENGFPKFDFGIIEWFNIAGFKIILETEKESIIDLYLK
jgi:hypothetical protein